MDNTTHTVKPGETLSGIASYYNISPWGRIAELNSITDATKLQIGQVLKLPLDTSSANDDAAAPSEQTAAELTPVRSWCLPFSTTAPSTDEVARYMRALQNEEHGFYGLGKNGFLHGGVHFSRALNAENSVHCIADGEIIAWRFNQDNEKITSGKDTAHYSTNFVLVRHRLELPNEKKETQDFYSLYMHLASLSESRDNARPTAFDPNKNKGTINVPNSPIAITAGELLGYIGQFSTGANNADTLHLEVFADTSLKQFINAGRHYDTTLPANQKPWLIVAPGAQTAKARSSDTTLKHALHTGKGAAGWALVQPCAKGIVLHKDVLTDFNNNSYPNNNRVREAVSRQSGVDENLLTSERAYWEGYYYDENWVRNTEAAHFNANFGARNNASATHRGILLPHGDPVWIKAPVQEEGTLHDAENIEAWHFPFSTDTLEGPEATDTAILFVSDIEASLEEQHDGKTIHWYQVTYTTDDGQHTGWVCSQGQTHISLHSQWSWPGFEVIDNTQLTLDQYFARHMLAGNNVTEEEKSTFQAPAQAVEAGPIFERIYQIISKQMEPLLPPKNIPKTMCKPKVQQDLSRLIIEQPTEWQSSKPWSCLDDYMHDEAKPGWDATKEQIDKLAWWDEVNTQAKLNLGSTVMNIHPVALVGNHIKFNKHPAIYINDKRVLLDFLYFYKNDEIAENDYEEAAKELDCEVNAIKAVAIVETGRAGSYYSHSKNDTVPAILYERHVFYRNTKNPKKSSWMLENPNIVHKRQSDKYGLYSQQYEKLMKAYALDQDAALMAASWGKFQILGENYKGLGYSSVKEFTKFISLSEKNHLKAFVQFIKYKGATKALKEKNWLIFAQKYNGLQQNGYDKKMEMEYEKLNKK